MSLHYLVTLEMFIAQVLPFNCYQKELRNLSHLNCDLQIHQIWIQLITACRKYCKKVYKSCITGLDLSTSPLTQWQHEPAWLTPLRVAVSVRPDQWCIFCTPSLAVFPTCCHQVDSNLANLEATVKIR